MRRTQAIFEDFTHEIQPTPSIEGSVNSCDGDDYYVHIGNSVAVSEFRIEVYESNGFGELAPGASIIAMNLNWVPLAGQNPIVKISSTPQITFLPNKWYTVKMYASECMFLPLLLQTSR